MAMPINEADEKVENIGVAYVAAERKSTLLDKGQYCRVHVCVRVCVRSEERVKQLFE